MRSAVATSRGFFTFSATQSPPTRNSQRSFSSARTCVTLMIGGGGGVCDTSLTMMRCATGPKSDPAKNKRGVDLISDALPFGRLWYGEPNAVSNAVDYAKFRSRSQRLQAFLTASHAP